MVAAGALATVSYERDLTRQELFVESTLSMNGAVTPERPVYCPLHVNDTAKGHDAQVDEIKATRSLCQESRSKLRLSIVVCDHGIFRLGTISDRIFYSPQPPVTQEFTAACKSFSSQEVQKYIELFQRPCL